MKKLSKAIIVTGAAFAAALYSGCSMLQGTLSDSMNDTFEAETGIASVSSNILYYNGSSSSDVSSSSCYLKIDFGQVVAVGSSGLSGSYTLSYTEASSGDSYTVKKSLPDNKGDLSADGTSYYLNLKGVMDVLDGASVTDNEVSVGIKLSGFVCNAGNQKGRSLSTFEKTINLKPLFSNTTLNGITVSTASMAAGRTINVPFNGKVSLSSSASASVEGDFGNWSISLGEDGMSVDVSSDTDLTGIIDSADLVITGIMPEISGISYTQTIPLSFVPGAVSTDFQGSNALASNYGISSVLVNDDGTNLIVKVTASSELSLYSNEAINVLIDNTGYDSTNDVIGTYNMSWPTITYSGSDYWPYLIYASSVVQSNCNIDAAASICTFELGSKDGYAKRLPVLAYDNGTAAAIELGDATVDGEDAAGFPQGSDWLIPVGTEIVFTIPLENIHASSGDVVNVALLVTGSKGNIAEYGPPAAVSGDLISWSAASITVDLSQGLSYTVE